MPYIINNYIAGKTITDNDLHPVHNPALGEVIGQVAFASTATCDQAIEAAKNAWVNWAETPPVKRSQILFNFRNLLQKFQMDLAKLVTQEHGKTLADAQGSVLRGIELVEHHCNLLQQLQGTFTPNVAQNIDCFTFRQPLGICVGVSPFNFPVMVPLWQIIPAIACGNTFILKPSEQDPSAPVRLLELLTEAGLPPGVANLLHGDKTVVDYLITHPAVKAVTAVASTPVAEHIYKTAIMHGKRAHTFGGAKNHCVVMPDCDIEQTAKAIVGAAFGSAGERCMAISVAVVIGDETADLLLEHMTTEIKAIKIAAGDTPNCDMGPLISKAHRAKVLAAINQGVTEGAKLLIDGRDYVHPTLPNGFFVGPCLFDAVTENMTIYQQEIFGPVLVIVRVPDFAAALELINNNQYGNGTAIFTRDGFIAREYAQKVQVGMVGINIPIPVPISSHPFGGWKNSAFGDNNMHGLESVHFYTRLKTVTSRWLVPKEGVSSFIMPTH